MLIANAAAFAASPSTPVTTPPDRRIAITIDDLPWQHITTTPADALPGRHAALMAQLKQAGAPVVGFVNEDKLEVDGQVQPARLAMLRDWLDAGYELGNHTYAHIDLHAVGLAEYEADILRGERELRPLLATYDRQPRWFRHPYLRAGRTQQEKQAVVDFLAVQGYRVAPVTVDDSDWVWNLAYEKVLDGQPDTPARAATLVRLQRGYVPYMLDKVDFYERESLQLLGRALPQVWLMHAHTLNSVAYADLIAGVHRRGYRTISLDEAMADPAYLRPDGYTGRYGPSWLQRWAMAEKRPKDFYAGEPVVPQWVMDLAGVDTE